MQRLGLDAEEEVFSSNSEGVQEEQQDPNLRKTDAQDREDMELRRLRLQLSSEETGGRSPENQVRLAELQEGRERVNVHTGHFDLCGAIKLMNSFNESHLDDFHFFFGGGIGLVMSVW